MSEPTAEQAFFANGAPGYVAGFVEAMLSRNPQFDTAYFLEKPWKWEEEYREWNRMDRPGEGDFGFDAFCDRLDEMERA